VGRNEYDGRISVCFCGAGLVMAFSPHFGKGDTIGGVIFLVTAILSAILFLRQLTGKRKKHGKE